MSDYVRVLYQKIDEIILEMARFDVYNMSESDFDAFFTYQNRINEYMDIIKSSRNRAMNQICYNQLMLSNYKKDSRKSDSMKDYVFLTVNPPDQLPYERLVSAVKNFVSSAFVEWSYYVFEQRGVEEGVYNGFHSHILFKRCRKPSVVLEGISRIFYPLVPDHSKVKFWSQSSLSDVVNAYSYMCGKKKDSSKSDKVLNDSRMRASYGLDSIYRGGEPPLLVGGSPVA